MRLILKQRILTFFDSYDVYDESDNVVYKIKGQLSWGHCFKIFDSQGNQVGELKEKLLSIFSTFRIYKNKKYVGCVRKRLTIFFTRFKVKFRNWRV